MGTSPRSRAWPYPIFCDWLREADIDIPRSNDGTQLTLRDWIFWFTESGTNLNDAHLARIWKGLDKIPLFTIVGVNLEEQT